MRLTSIFRIAFSVVLLSTLASYAQAQDSGLDLYADSFSLEKDNPFLTGMEHNSPYGTTQDLAAFSHRVVSDHGDKSTAAQVPTAVQPAVNLAPAEKPNKSLVSLICNFIGAICLIGLFGLVRVWKKK